MWSRKLSATEALAVVRQGKSPTFLLSGHITKHLHVMSYIPLINPRRSISLAVIGVFLAREQIWPNPGQQEQLVLFELCRYRPNDAEGIYRNWRMQIDRRLAQATAGGSGQTGGGTSGRT